VPENLSGTIEIMIIKKAKELGATLAGIADGNKLKNSPSYKTHGKCNLGEEVGSVVALALKHNPDEPELDYWDALPGRTPGNRRLIEIAKSLKKWLMDEYGIQSKVLSYNIRKGGTYLKDAGALAGMGIIGKNNLLITPDFGPRVRVCALAVNAELHPSIALDFAPCDGCEMPCRTVCPQNAFGSGSFNLPDCRKQMDADERSTKTGIITKIIIRYCRECELACVVGK